FPVLAHAAAPCRTIFSSWTGKAASVNEALTVPGHSFNRFAQKLGDYSRLAPLGDSLRCNCVAVLVQIALKLSLAIQEACLPEAQAMFLFKYIPRLFLAAFPLPVLLRPVGSASILSSAPSHTMLRGAGAFKLQPLLARAVLEPNFAAPSLLSRFRIGPYANGPP
ncbi:MAG: hypothetical protein ACLPX9_13025, partial [Rhodomicrobium sp.]